MHIEQLTINIGHPGALAGALLAAMAAMAAPRTETADKPAATSTDPLTPPAIGEEWEGQGGIYAGLSRGEDGAPDAHLVLLDDKPEGSLTWSAAVAWAQGLGDGARLPTRFESALLYANVRDQLDTGNWHWTGTQDSASDAWIQHFYYGSQSSNSKSYEGRARAVRRLKA